MRQLDENDAQPLGKKIQPPAAPAPTSRKHNKAGTVVVNPDGSMSTNLPPPPPAPPKHPLYDFFYGYSMKGKST